MQYLRDSGLQVFLTTTDERLVWQAAGAGGAPLRGARGAPSGSLRRRARRRTPEPVLGPGRASNASSSRFGSHRPLDEPFGAPPFVGGGVAENSE